MRKFFLIDHSLKNAGGHHFPYAVSVIAAAARGGFTPVLGTHRDFREHGAFDPACRVVPVFNRESYSPHAFDTQATLAAGPRTAGGIVERLHALWRRRVRDLHARVFAADCQRLFDAVPPAAGDVVFFATASELDFAGLARFIAGAPLDADIEWQLQFHFGFFRGRDPGWDAQSGAEAAMRASIADSLERAKGARIRAFCTTEALTRQYNRLRLLRFTTLPYPVHPLFRAATPLPSPPRAAGLARIALLGHSRREKGYGALPSLIEELWDRHLGRGRAELLLQGIRPALRQALERLTLRLAGRSGASEGSAPLHFAPGALDLPAYAALLRGSDVGVLLYDGERYYDRCSGVLLELLCAGIPVVVPAGSWLSTQIDAPNQRYLAALAEDATRVPRDADLPLQWAGEPRDLREVPVSATFVVTFGTAAVLFECRWQSPKAPGTYLRVTIARPDDGNAREVVYVLEPGIEPAPLRCLFPTPPAGGRLTLSVGNAFAGEALTITDVRVRPILGPAPPLGAVGLAIARPTDAGMAVDEILTHLEHYRRASLGQTRDAAERFGAEAILAQLTGTSRG